MKLACLLFALTISAAFARPKVALLDTRRALISTEEGKAATAKLHRKFDPEQSKLQEQESEIGRLRSEGKSIDNLVTSHRRATEDARQRFEVEQKRVYKELSDKMIVVVKKYAHKKHYEAVLDESDPNSNVLWRDDKNDITDEIIKLYDRASKKP